MRASKRVRTVTAVVTLAAVLMGAMIALQWIGERSRSASTATSVEATPSATATGGLPRSPLTVAEVAALPEARYDAVIPGLIAYRHDGVPPAATATYSIAADAALYGIHRDTPVARFAATNFLGQNSVIVPVQFDGSWALVMTPSRQVLPSQGLNAPAQSAGWLRRDLLTKVQDLRSHILVGNEAQTISIIDAFGAQIQTFEAAVGAAGTPTPTGVVGYIQARYLDPAQGQSVYPIELTSLHSAAVDEPFIGQDGGLVGIHYFSTPSGTQSRGCIRLDVAAITAINQLPLGTPIVIAE